MLILPAECKRYVARRPLRSASPDSSDPVRLFLPKKRAPEIGNGLERNYVVLLTYRRHDFFGERPSLATVLP